MAANEWLQKEPRAVWTCVISLRYTSSSGGSICAIARYNFFVCGPKFITWPGKVWLEYSHYPRSYRGAHTLNFKPNFKFSSLFFGGGGPPSQFGCALASLLQSVARIKIWGHITNFFVCGPKFTNFFSPSLGGVVVDELLSRFSICGSVPEIFPIKVESCQKLCRIWNVFRHPGF